jgi:hypothetical protein
MRGKSRRNQQRIRQVNIRKSKFANSLIHEFANLGMEVELMRETEYRASRLCRATLEKWDEDLCVTDTFPMKRELKETL